MDRISLSYIVINFRKLVCFQDSHFVEDMVVMVGVGCANEVCMEVTLVWGQEVSVLRVGVWGVKLESCHSLNAYFHCKSSEELSHQNVNLKFCHLDCYKAFMDIITRYIFFNIL